ncbi:hypothetical protein [Aestuariivirga sp.]|uniref:hypothetical protein n=1 Tax=Aestuariivirga sp. TaxID=2650926 RepID=UPI0025C1EB2E|nr:hypothetical protein [Aestuariivirga sp.]MCA3553975.1 hypothetical protein [Aestuariivirga sp.]
MRRLTVGRIRLAAQATEREYCRCPPAARQWRCANPGIVAQEIEIAMFILRETFRIRTNVAAVEKPGACSVQAKSPERKEHAPDQKLEHDLIAKAVPLLRIMLQRMFRS